MYLSVVDVNIEEVLVVVLVGEELVKFSFKLRNVIMKKCLFIKEKLKRYKNLY